MKLNEQQRAWLESIAKTTDSKMLCSILEGYIIELKDEVLDERLTPSIGKAAVGKLAELVNKILVLSGEKVGRDPSMFT